MAPRYSSLGNPDFQESRRCFQDVIVILGDEDCLRAFLQLELGRVARSLLCAFGGRQIKSKSGPLISTESTSMKPLSCLTIPWTVGKPSNRMRCLLYDLTRLLAHQFAMLRYTYEYYTK